MPALPRVLSLALLTTSTASLLACGFLTDSVTEKVEENINEAIVEAAIEQGSEGNTQVDIQDGKVRVQTDQGTFTAGEGAFKTATGFPDSLKPYPGATVTGGMSTSGPDGQINMVNFRTADSPDKVVGFYKAEYAAQYSSKTEANQDGASMLILAQSDTKGGLAVNATPAEGGTEVVLSQTVPAAAAAQPK